MAITSKGSGNYADKTCVITAVRVCAPYASVAECDIVDAPRFVYGIGIYGRGSWGLGTGDAHFAYGHRIYGLGHYGVGLQEIDVAETVLVCGPTISKTSIGATVSNICDSWATVNTGVFSVRDTNDCDYSSKTCTAFVIEDECEAYATQGDGNYSEDNEDC